MEAVFRSYKPEDYKQCESLVNEAWKFDKNFRPQELANLTKYIYTKGSVLSSNYKQIVEVNGKVAGFIFGFNEHFSKPKRKFLFGLIVLWRLYRINYSEHQSRKKLLNAINTHEKNRSSVVDRGRSEIVLFVVGSNYQKLGYGKSLWLDFKSYCIDYGVKSIIVETNKLGASSFYEQLGFLHIADFDSPLHEYATEGGQACMYEYVCK